MPSHTMDIERMLEERFRGREVPEAYKILSRRPETLLRFIEFRDSIMAEGKLNPILKEKIALAVSKVNYCNPCLISHSRKLEMMGESIEPLNEREKAALSFAAKIAITKGKLEDEEIQKILEIFDYDELLEIALVASLYMFLNTFNNLLVR
ncbi:conserved hypothetical protein [Archaeoglobus fulgidus DSM 4304]|jgi:AhpD family alkylhydroperoxidase|uniref:Carboxymuconolactone decarboxylase-like domain-containing protein n=4 Tax=Archaeoglobus fulgidus TaxID=2234 RepID=O30263_ARCFU|nr:conserved hypothetical protein [Archaeoglobus fulgidus DSM 4304]